MMGIVVLEKCWAYKKYNKIISGIYLDFILQLTKIQIYIHLIHLILLNLSLMCPVNAC